MVMLYHEPAYVNQTLHQSNIELQEEIFSQIAPLNIFFAVFILVQNTIILADYYPDRRRLEIAMFMLIAVADIVSAVAELGRGSLALVCLRDEGAAFSKFLPMVFTLVGLCSYSSSIFYTTVLTVVKTISISCPFYSLNKKAIYRSLLLVSVFLISVSIADGVYWSGAILSTKVTPCRQNWNTTYNGVVTGCGIIWYFISRFEVGFSKLSNLVWVIVMVVEYLVPCSIIFICMLIQTTYIKKALSGSGNPDLKTANHINLTVFLISMLYFLCISSFGVFYIISSFFIPTTVTMPIAEVHIQLTLRYTLPLVNAAIFPIIIILRKQSLRQMYKERVVWLRNGCLLVLCLPVRGARLLLGRGTQQYSYSRLLSNVE